MMPILCMKTDLTAMRKDVSLDIRRSGFGQSLRSFFGHCTFRKYRIREPRRLFHPCRFAAASSSFSPQERPAQAILPERLAQAARKVKNSSSVFARCALSH